MRLSKKILPLVAVCSALAFTQGAAAKVVKQDQDFIDQMTQIEEIADSQVYLATESTFTASSTTLQIEEEMRDVYVTKEEAEELGLTETLSFRVYSNIDRQQISNTIAKMIHRDAPTYFSVELFENQIGRSDMIEYVAKVTEYK